MLVAQLVPTQPRTPAAHRSTAHRSPAAHHDPAAHANPVADGKPAADGSTAVAGKHAAEAGADATALEAVQELALLRRQQHFDVAMKQRAEDEREANVLRELAMAQLKKDDENLKKWVAMI